MVTKKQETNMLYEKIKKKFRLSLYTLCSILAFSSSFVYGGMHPAVEKIIKQKDSDSTNSVGKAYINHIIEAKNLLMLFLYGDLPRLNAEEIKSFDLEKLRDKCLELMEKEEKILTSFQKKIKGELSSIPSSAVPGLYAHRDKEYEKIFSESRKIVVNHFESLVRGAIPEEEFKIGEEDFPVYIDGKVSTQFYGTPKLEFLLHALFFVWKTIGKDPNMMQFLYEIPTAAVAPLQNESIIRAFEECGGGNSIFLCKENDSNNRECRGIIHIGPWMFGGGRHPWNNKYPLNKFVGDQGALIGQMLPESDRFVGNSHIQDLLKYGPHAESQGKSLGKYLYPLKWGTPLTEGDILVKEPVSEIYLGKGDSGELVTLCSKSNFVGGVRGLMFSIANSSIMGALRPNETIIENMKKTKKFSQDEECKSFYK